ncbi:GGDEF domain-containing protein (plasmid) [Paroceanicella profunda]|uniref:diguanylate cyclase n=2 Tax=Paroceanicella profunda TaxID=2579971 RepID=A0A5B8FIY7_9RHOB|nr:GGDEF domain-containing protein [Paroceanicella profunda]
MLLLEAVLYFGVMAFLFRVRHWLGSGIFFCTLGSMHFLETYLAATFYVSVPGGFMLSPGSTVLFSGKLVLLLLVYLRENAAVVRQPIYGLLVGNLFLVGLVFVLRLHAALNADAGTSLPDLPFLDTMGWLMIWGSTLLYIDCLMIILLYNHLARLVSRPVLRIWLASSVVLTFDQIGFFAALHVIMDMPYPVLFGGWMAKMVAAALFSGLSGVYLRWIEPATSVPTPLRLGEVFEVLTYQQRYLALVEQAGRDPLTGLQNRTRLETLGAETVARLARDGRSFGLLIADVDRFKQVNDSYGHAAGDQTLQAVAAALQSCLGEGDLAFRYGGEEFVVLFADHTAAEVAEVADQILRAIRAGHCHPADSDLTASIGFAMSPADGSDLNALFQRADERLYEAKRAGRDRAVGPRLHAATRHATPGLQQP